VGEAPPDTPQSTEAVIAWEKAKKYLQDSDWSMLPDISMLSNKKLEWIEYRRALREIRLQPDFPTSINWPVKPE
jgi:hypothetical protein